MTNNEIADKIKYEIDSLILERKAVQMKVRFAMLNYYEANKKRIKNLKKALLLLEKAETPEQPQIDFIRELTKTANAADLAANSEAPSA